jgi:hypothetical protein
MPAPYDTRRSAHPIRTPSHAAPRAIRSPPLTPSVLPCQSLRSPLTAPDVLALSPLPKDPVHVRACGLWHIELYGLHTTPRGVAGRGE